MAFVSMAGLDLSFLKETPKKKRGRPRKKIEPAKSAYQRQMDEIKTRVKAQPSKRATDISCPVLMQDITPFVSPVDGSEISSRSKLRAHEQKHGIKQCGDFKKGEIVKEVNKRAAEIAAIAEPETCEWK